MSTKLNSINNDIAKIVHGILERGKGSPTFPEETDALLDLDKQREDELHSHAEGLRLFQIINKQLHWHGVPTWEEMQPATRADWVTAAKLFREG